MSEVNEALVLAAEPSPEPYRDETDTQVSEAWRIEDLSGADWALSRLADLRREIAENEAVAEDAIRRVRLRTQILNERAERGVQFFKDKVRAYAEAHRDDLLRGGKKKSRTLLHGSIGWRKSGGGLVVNDEDALLDWARSQPFESGVLRIKEEPAVEEIKRQFKATGHLPPGTDVSPEEEELVIKIEMGAGNGD